MSAFDELVSSYHDSIGLGKCEITDNAYSEREELLEELASLLATVAALTAERDAAYRRGWCDAREAAAKSLIDAADYSRSEWMRTSGGKDASSSYLHDANCQHAMSERIRAMQPQTEQTEHDAAEDHRSYAAEAWNELHEFDGAKCQCACVCTRDADRYVDGLPSCEFCAKL